MRFNPPFLAAGLLLSLTTLNAEASLTSYTGAGGAGLVYSSVSNITWTQDANLFKTLYDANNNLVNLITAVTPSYNDPYYGVQVIGDGGEIDDFNTSNGRMTWWGSIAFTNYLNSINYGGSNQWALPSAGANAQRGYNVSGHVFDQLYYNELGGTAYSGSFPNTSTFNNEQDSVYWMGSNASPNVAWLFYTGGGYTVWSINELIPLSAWAVSPGQVPAVPVPGAVWLFGTGLLGLLGLKQRRHAG